MKNDRKIHESRISGAAWILEIAKRDGIEKAEEELKRRGAVRYQQRFSMNLMRKLSGTR